MIFLLISQRVTPLPTILNITYDSSETILNITYDSSEIKGSTKKSIQEMFPKCKWLEGKHKEIASENKVYFKNIREESPYMVPKVPQNSYYLLNGRKLVLMVELIYTVWITSNL